MHDETQTPLPPKRRRVRTEAAGAIQRLVEAQRLTHKHRILCYGCGRGVDVEWLRARNFPATGYDPHEPFGFAAPPRGKFDYVFLMFLMKRLKTDENRRESIGKAAAYARPGGSLVIATRNVARNAAEAGFEGQDAPLEYVRGLLGEELFTGVAPSDFAPGDGSRCFIARRSGAHKPANPVTFVDSQAGLERACRAVSKAGSAGLDVETTLEEPRELCTIQLGTADRTWIIDALAMNDLSPFKAIMENPDIEKIIHNALFEEQMLAKHEIRILNIFDTLPASRTKYKGKNVEGGHNLGAVCERELNIYLDKSLQTSDWKQRPLSAGQLDYAAIDAEVLPRLVQIFKPPKEPEILELFPDD